jgi:hypothetical protein
MSASCAMVNSDRVGSLFLHEKNQIEIKKPRANAGPLLGAKITF